MTSPTHAPRLVTGYRHAPSFTPLRHGKASSQ